jgi:transposase
MSKASSRFSLEVRDHTVHMVGEHRSEYASEWAALTSIAGKIGSPLWHAQDLAPATTGRGEGDQVHRRTPEAGDAGPTGSTTIASSGAPATSRTPTPSRRGRS